MNNNYTCISNEVLDELILHKVVFLKVNGHYLEVKLAMSDLKIKIRASLKTYKDRLIEKNFINPNQSIMINLLYVKEIDKVNKKVVMHTGDIIDISRDKYKEVLTQYIKYIGKYEESVEFM